MGEDRIQTEDLFDDMLGSRIKTLKLGKHDWVVYPAGIPELRDLSVCFKHMQDAFTGDLEEIPPEYEADKGTIIYQFWADVLWLLLRQGSPGMTDHRAFKEEYEIERSDGVRLLDTFVREYGPDDVEEAEEGVGLTVGDLAVEAGLLDDELVSNLSGKTSPNSETQPSSLLGEKPQDGEEQTGQKSGK